MVGDRARSSIQLYKTNVLIMASWSNISTLIVELANGKRYFTEKTLLARHSEYFRRSFLEGSYDVDTNIIGLWDVSHDEFKLMLNYFQNVEDRRFNVENIFTKDNIFNFLELAHRFESTTLEEGCFCYIRDQFKELDLFTCLESAMQTQSETLKKMLEQKFAEALDQEETASSKSFLTAHKDRINGLSLMAQSFILKIIVDCDGRKAIRLKFERSQKESLDKRLVDFKKTLEKTTKDLEEARKAAQSDELKNLRQQVLDLKESVKLAKDMLKTKEEEHILKMEEEKTYRHQLQERVADLLVENETLETKRKETEHLLFELEFEQSLGGSKAKKDDKLSKIWDSSSNAKEVDLLLFDDSSTPLPIISQNEPEEEGLVDWKNVELSTIMFDDDLQLFDVASYCSADDKRNSREINDSFQRFLVV